MFTSPGPLLHMLMQYVPWWLGRDRWIVIAAVHGFLLQNVAHAMSAGVGLPCWSWEDSLPTISCQLPAAKTSLLPTTTLALCTECLCAAGGREAGSPQPNCHWPLRCLLHGQLYLLH